MIFLLILHKIREICVLARAFVLCVYTPEDPYILCANSEGFHQTAWMRRLV